MALLIFLVALLLRLPSILRGDFAFTYDTGRDLLAVREILAGNFSLIGPTTGLNGIFYGPWWYWMLAPWSLIFGGNPVAMAALIAILGSLAAAAAYIWGRKFAGQRFGAILGLILAASPGIVKVTNQLWNPNVLIPATVAVVMLIGNMRRLRAEAFILLGCLLALFVEFEIVYGILFGISFVISSILWRKGEFSLLKIRNLFLGIILVELPRILFELRHGFIQTKTFLSQLGGSAIAFHPKRDWLIYENLSSVLPGTPIVQNILMALVLLSLVLYWKRNNAALRRLVLFFLTVVSIFWVMPFFYPQDFWNYYFLGLPVLYSVIVASAWIAIPKRFSKIGAIFVVVYFFFLIQPARIYSSFTHPYFVGDAAVYRNQREVLEFIRKESTTTFKYIAYNPAQHDYNWQYLFWWYKNRGKLPTYTENNPSIMYVILEPDDSYPDRLKNWLTVRERDGVLLREVTFSSGIIVQIRRLRWN